jgi:hypothetical protein
MNFVFAAGGIPTPIEFSINGFVVAAIFAAAFIPWYFAPSRTGLQRAAPEAAPEVDARVPDFGAFDAPGQRAA